MFCSTEEGASTLKRPHRDSSLGLCSARLHSQASKDVTHLTWARGKLQDPGSSSGRTGKWTRRQETGFTMTKVSVGLLRGAGHLDVQ